MGDRRQRGGASMGRRRVGAAHRLQDGEVGSSPGWWRRGSPDPAVWRPWMWALKAGIDGSHRIRRVAAPVHGRHQCVVVGRDSFPNRNLCSPEPLIPPPSSDPAAARLPLNPTPRAPSQERPAATSPPGNPRRRAPSPEPPPSSNPAASATALPGSPSHRHLPPWSRRRHSFPPQIASQPPPLASPASRPCSSTGAALPRNHRRRRSPTTISLGTLPPARLLRRGSGQPRNPPLR